MRQLTFIVFLVLTNGLFCQSEEGDSLVFREIKVSSKGVKIFSQAYMHYPHIFRDFDRKALFDSTSFEERFVDISFANIVKIEPDIRDPKVYETIALDVYKGGIKKEIWFTFKRNEGYSQSLFRKNPELNAFTGMAWVYNGSLKKKQFKKTFIFYKRRKRRQWSDFRIYYDNSSQKFKINLKNTEGFVELEAYPRYTALSRDIKESQEAYEKIYGNYLKSLGKRKNKFEKTIQKRKNSFYNSLKAYDENLWKKFQENYMSEEERLLSREDWLVYYDKVIANERKAMGNASPNQENVIRSINIDGYKQKASSSLLSDDNNNNYKTLYQNSNQDKLAITDILLVDVEQKTYKKYIGSKGIKTINIDLPDNSNIVLIAWLRNGDIGYVSQDELRNFTADKNNQILITLNVINRKFASVQTLREELLF